MTPARTLVFAASICIALTQTPLSGQRYSFKLYGASDGLTNLAVRRLFQDTAGYLWASTEGGVYRYDGYRFRQFGPADGLPKGVGHIDGGPDGSAWVTLDGGVYRFQDDRFQRVPLPDTARVGPYDGIAWDRAGTSYLATDRGLLAVRINKPGGLEFRKIPQAPGVGAPVVQSANYSGSAVWYGCATQICRLSGTEILVWGREAGLPEFPWRNIRVDPDGDVWALAYRSLYVMRRGTGHFTHPPSQISPVGMEGPVALSDGRTMLPTADGILMKEHGEFRLLGRDAGVPHPVYSILEDREGSIWLGLPGHGLARWLGNRAWESFDESNGLLPAIIHEIAVMDADQVFAGTGRGLWRGERKSATWTWRRNPAVPELPIHVVQRGPDGELWVGGEGAGLSRLDPGRDIVQAFGKARGLPPTVLAVFIDSHRRIWVGTPSGLFAGSLPNPGFTAVPEVSKANVRQIVEGVDGSIWVASTSGAYQLQNGTWRKFTKADGLLSSYLLALLPDPAGGVWAGYREGGVSRIRVRGDKLQAEHFDQPDREASGLTYFLNFDAQKRLWTGTDQGIDIYDGKRWTRINTADGLIWDDCDLHAFALSPDGSVWIGTSAGLSHFDPKQAVSRQPPLEVRLDNLRLGGKPVTGTQASTGYRANSFAVQFSVLSFAREHAMRFRYRLEPSQRDWLPTTEHQLHFLGLAPNSYRLDVEALTPSGDWTAPASFAFEVQQPPWNNAAARVAYVVTILGCMWWLTAWRKRVQDRALLAQRRELERDRIVAEAAKHLDAITHMNRVASLSELASSLAHEISQPISSIGVNTHEALRLVRTGGIHPPELTAILNDIRADDQRASGIIQKMRGFLKRSEPQLQDLDVNLLIDDTLRLVRTEAVERKIEIRVNLAPGIPLVRGDSIQLQQVLVNLLSNAMTSVTQSGHSPGAIAVRTLPAQEGTGVQIEVEDNGQGILPGQMERLFEPFFSTKPDGMGMGLSISRSIVESFGGRIWAENVPGSGACLKVLLITA